VENNFVVRDSGERASFASGMVRDISTDKLRPDLVDDGPMLLRWILLVTRGAVKYAARNWMKACGREEYDRFLESTDRHYIIWKWYRKYGLNIEQLPDGPITREPLKEDHAAAVIFNINGTEYVAEQIERGFAEVPGASAEEGDPDNIGWEPLADSIQEN
jgi:hypothetical protein